MSGGLFAKARRSLLIRRILLFFVGLLSQLNRIIPKRDNLVLFYESQGSFPQDNTEAMCSWLIENDARSRFDIWYCVGTIPARFAERGVKRCSPAHAALLYLRSGYVFYSFGGLRIKPARNQHVVNLWHGSPLKTIGKMTSDSQYGKEELCDFTVLLTAAPLFAPLMAMAFGVDESLVKVAGYPRCDYFDSCRTVDVKSFLRAPLNSKLILWMPTFRSSCDGRFANGRCTSTGLPLMEDVACLARANDELLAAGCFMVIKAHPFAAESYAGNFSNIAFVTDTDLYEAGIRLYEFVASFDVLLTDYSSIYFDWLLLNRPVGFIVDDFEEYRDTRGFGFEDPLSLMPGPKLRSIDDLMVFFRDAGEGRDEHEEDRMAVCRVANAFDCNFSERVAKLVGIRFQE